MPEISVIVPIYNVEQYLKPCIDSILAQSFRDFELILVDDGSPDHCGEICDEYKKRDDRIVIIHKENGGLSDARNKGIDIAKGNYLTFIDSDDLVHQDYLKVLHNTAVEYDADISVCSFELFDDNQKVDLLTDYTNYSVWSIRGKEACLELYNSNSQLSVIACAKLYKCTIFENLRYPENKINEDEGTIPIAMYSAKTVAISYLKLYKYRQHEKSIMNRSFSAKRFDALDCIQICIDHFQKVSDASLADIAKKYQETIQAKLIIEAISQNAASLIPSKYRMSKYKCIRILYHNLDKKRFTWYIAKLNPKYVTIYEYFKKLEHIIH